MPRPDVGTIQAIMSDHSTGKFLAKALSQRATEVEQPPVDTVPGTRLDWVTDGIGPPGPTEHRLTKVEQRQHELARAVEGVDREVRSMRAEQIRMREVMAQANVLNRQVAAALESLTEDKAQEGKQVEKLRLFQARVVGITVGASTVIGCLTWLIERALSR